MTDVRCPTCDKLLARILDSGKIEMKKGGKTLAIISRGEIVCERCNSKVTIEACSIDMTPSFIV